MLFRSIILQASEWLQYGTQQPMSSTHDAGVKGEFDWDNLSAHTHLSYTPCYGEDFQCARLTVPMDWIGGSEEAAKNNTVELAIIRVPATVDVTDEKYGGAVILNPGGPGGSGIRQVLRGGHNVRTLLSAGSSTNDKTGRHFDVIGFDPRGINNTRPLLSCFPSQLERAAWTLEEQTNGNIDYSDKSFDFAWAAKRALAKGCTEIWNDVGITKHMATASVARDIVEIAEQHGFWRERRAQQLLSHGKVNIDAKALEAAMERVQYRKDQEMVQYWGFSYGTVLGATLASMFPHRIQRAILDGVADSRDYMAGGWSTNLRDTDKLWDKLGEYCFHGGPDNCKLYDKDGPKYIDARIDTLLFTFKHNPISIPGNSTHGPMVVTISDFMRMIREMVYNPLRDLSQVMEVIYELSIDSGNTLAEFKRNNQPELGRPLSQECLKDGPYSPACQASTGTMNWEGTYGVACSDGAPRTKQTKDEFAKYAKEITGQSKLMGASWSDIQLPCTAWHARPNWRYNGDFRDARKENRTAHPILFLGNSRDPVTPLYNAFAMSFGFDDAGVLHLNSEGHCSYGSVSMCAGKAIREYFQTGALPHDKHNQPPAGEAQGWTGPYAYCEPDRFPLDGYTNEEKPALPKHETDQEMWDALVALNREFQ